MEWTAAEVVWLEALGAEAIIQITAWREDHIVTFVIDRPLTKAPRLILPLSQFRLVFYLFIRIELYLCKVEGKDALLDLAIVFLTYILFVSYEVV